MLAARSLAGQVVLVALLAGVFFVIKFIYYLSCRILLILSTVQEMPTLRLLHISRLFPNVCSYFRIKKFSRQVDLDDQTGILSDATRVKYDDIYIIAFVAHFHADFLLPLLPRIRNGRTCE